ncbi:MAG: hypothetical protein ACI9XU_001819 [Arenicella sp.]|jgi:hypothetical protein
MDNYLPSVYAVACEPFIDVDASEPQTLVQRKKRLPNHLLAQDQAPFKQDRTATQMTESMVCYLNAIAQHIQLLQQTAPQLKQLGLALENSNSPDSTRNALNRINRSVNRDAGTTYLQFPNDNDSTLDIDLFSDFLKPTYTKYASDSCAKSLSVAQHLWWIGGIYRALAGNHNKSGINASLTYNDRLVRKWQSYKDDTILLWPQEVLLNSLVFNPDQKGLHEPPNYELLSLRPALGLSYLSDAKHHFQPTLNVDLLGVYWWRYGGPDGASAQAGRGIAATLIVNGSDTALGLTYHHNPKWSATIAQGDDNDLVVSLSFQLASWFLK